MANIREKSLSQGVTATGLTSPEQRAYAPSR
jgi:hypothetical protein